MSNLTNLFLMCVFLNQYLIFLFDLLALIYSPLLVYSLFARSSQDRARPDSFIGPAYHASIVSACPFIDDDFFFPTLSKLERNANYRIQGLIDIPISLSSILRFHYGAMGEEVESKVMIAFQKA